MEKKSLFQRIRQSLKLDDEMDEAQIRKAAGLIRNIFRYMDKDAKDIMTHRKNIVAIDATETLENAFQFMLGESYSRFPIYEEDIDQIIGFIHLREAATCYLDESLRKRPVKELDTYIRSVSFIPETKSIDKLFKEMQTKKITLLSFWMNMDRLPVLLRWKIFWKRLLEIFWTNTTKKKR